MRVGYVFIRVFQNKRFNRFLRLFASLTNNDYRARGFSLQLKIGWFGVLELVGLFRLRTRTFEAKNCQEVSADALFCFLNIFVENKPTNAE